MTTSEDFAEFANTVWSRNKSWRIWELIEAYRADSLNRNDKINFRKWTEESVREAVDMYASGKTYNQIANIIGTSHKSVKGVVQRANGIQQQRQYYHTAKIKREARANVSN